MLMDLDDRADNFRFPIRDRAGQRHLQHILQHLLVSNGKIRPAEAGALTRTVRLRQETIGHRFRACDMF